MTRKKDVQDVKEVTSFWIVQENTFLTKKYKTTPPFPMERTPSYCDTFLTQQTPTKENKSPANDVSRWAIGKTIHVNDATKQVIAERIARRL
jgi:hypothetical protein